MSGGKEQGEKRKKLVTGSLDGYIKKRKPLTEKEYNIEVASKEDDVQLEADVPAEQCSYTGCYRQAYGHCTGRGTSGSKACFKRFCRGHLLSNNLCTQHQKKPEKKDVNTCGSLGCKNTDVQPCKGVNNMCQVPLCDGHLDENCAQHNVEIGNMRGRELCGWDDGCTRKQVSTCDVCSVGLCDYHHNEESCRHHIIIDIDVLHTTTAKTRDTTPTTNNSTAKTQNTTTAAKTRKTTAQSTKNAAIQRNNAANSAGSKPRKPIEVTFTKHPDIVNPGDPIPAETNIVNKFKWDWLLREDENSDHKEVFENYLVKIKHPGLAYCMDCSSVVDYNSGGITKLKRHSSTPKHRANVKLRKDRKQTLLPASMCVNTPPATHHVPTEKDRTTRMEIQTLCFAAENNLSFAVTERLSELLKEAAKDPAATRKLCLSESSVRRKIVHGLGKDFNDTLSETLRTTPFSMNLDEAEAKNSKDKMLGMIISYFSVARGKTLIYHLDTKSIQNTQANTMFEAVDRTLTERKIPWAQLVSVLTDNCNAMVGDQIGVETQIRSKNPNLLKLGGDTVHKVNTAAEKLTDPFENWTEDLLHALFVDFKHSTQNDTWFGDICYLLQLPTTTVGRFVNTRWVNIYHQALLIITVWDALLVYYFPTLKEDQQKEYKPLIDQIMKDNEVNKECLAKIQDTQKKIGDQWSTIYKSSKSLNAKKRKVVIHEHLYDHRCKTLLQLDFIVVMMKPMNIYIKEFQAKSMMAHKFIDEQIRLTHEQMKKFIKPEVLRNVATGAKLKKYIVKEDQLLNKNQMLIVRNSTKDKCKEMNLVEYEAFLVSARRGMKVSTQYLIDHLSLGSELLLSLSALDPIVHPSEAGITHLKNLRNYFPTAVKHEERDAYNAEIHDIGSPTSVPLPPAMVDGKLVKADEWWGELLKSRKFPTLEKVLQPALSLITGPIVESLFSEIQNTITDKRVNITASTVASMQSIRTTLRMDGRPAELFPVGPNAGPSSKNSAVRATQKAHVVDADTLAEQKRLEMERDATFGVTRITKKKAQKNVMDSFKNL